VSKRALKPFAPASPSTQSSKLLNTVITGEATERLPLLIVHGLYGSARNWGVIAKRLSTDRQVISVDMRNHAHSFRADSNSYFDMAADLAEVLDAHGPMHVLGHSMGGKAAMVLALTGTASLRSLLVADIAPVTYASSENAQLADKLKALDLSQVERRSDADRLLQDSIPNAGTRAFLLQSLDLKEKRWLLNLDVLSAEMPKIASFPEDVTGEFRGPTLFLLGAESDYVDDAGRARAKELFPHARFAKITGAGHWLHADKPREFEENVRGWLGVLDRTDETADFVR